MERNQTTTEAVLIAEQLRRSLDILRSEIRQVKQIQEHIRELNDHRLSFLEETTRDHETRLRTVTDGVTQFKVWSGLASGSSGLMSIIALIRSWIF